VDSQAGRGMNTSLGAYLTMAWTFGLMSLLAIGGANSVIPEMHRLAVDVHHWMNDAQFADMFGIAQLSPGPNVLIVTLIGYHVAGIGGAAVATLAMCGPSAMFAYFINHVLKRSSHSPWPALLQAALVPVSIGLMCASGLVLALTVDRSWAAAGLTIAAAVATFTTNLNPLWMLVIGGCIGFAGAV
jgi:chromate transporter